MSVLRIIFGVMVGVCFLAGLAFLGQRFPGVTPRVVMPIICWSSGAFMFYVLLHGLRKGVILINAKGMVSIYERQKNPFGFWFYIFLLSILGITFVAFGICFLFKPELLK